MNLHSHRSNRLLLVLVTALAVIGMTDSPTAALVWKSRAMSDGASLTQRPGSPLSFDSLRYKQRDEAAQNPGLPMLLEIALRSVAGDLGRSTLAGVQIPTPLMLIGIRG